MLIVYLFMLKSDNNDDDDDADSFGGGVGDDFLGRYLLCRSSPFT